MKVYTHSEARQRLSSLLEEASETGGVRIRRRDGRSFVVKPVVDHTSPLDVPGVDIGTRDGEGLERVLAGREEAGERVLDAAVRRPEAAGGRAE